MPEKKTSQSSSSSNSENVEDPDDNDDDDDDEVKAPVKFGDIVDSQFKIMQILGQGGFGAVFEVLDLRSNKNYALKIELQEPDPDEAGLKLEISVLKRMQRNKHFPRFVHSGKHRRLTYLVMQRLGENLRYLRRKCPKRQFTLSTSVQLSYQTLECIEAMHHADLLHRDIKPENFVTGRTPLDRRIIYLLDFGMVRSFRIKGVLRAARPTAAFRGTISYASPRVLNNKDAGRCDDMFSWLYVIIEFFKGPLPWHTERSNRRRMLELKCNKGNELLADLPPEIKDLYNMIDSLGFADEPPCQNIRDYLDKMKDRKCVRDTDPFDWEPSGAYYNDVFSKLGKKLVKLKKIKEVPKSRCDEPTMETFVLDVNN